MSISKKVFLLFAIAAIFASCKKDKTITIDLKENYFPLEVGKSVVYEVDSILFSPLYQDGKDSVSWLLKETVAEVFKDDEGRDVYRIERFIRKTETDNWQPTKVFFAVKEKNKAERQENNLRFIRMVFPPKVGMSWNGNALINTDTAEYYQDWEYEFTAVDEPATINGNSFSETVTILEVDDENLLEKRYSEAQYAMNVGLIYKEQYNLRIVDSNIPPQSTPWEDKANRGYIMRMRIKSY